jgi:chromosome segregation ATPase
MSKFKFFSNFAKTKLKQANDAVITKLAEMDPEAAGETQKQIINENIAKIRPKLIEARKAYEKDVQETNDWVEKGKRVTKALKILKKEYETSEDPSVHEKAKTLKADLDNINENIKREKQEDAQAKDVLEQTQKVYDQLCDKKRQIESHVESAKRKLASAKAKRNAAELKKQHERELQGLSGSLDGLDVALGAIEKAAEKADTEAEAINLEVEEIASSGSIGNSNEALLEEVLGKDAKKKDQIDDPFAGI